MAILFLVLLLKPGLAALDPLGAVLMIVARLAWEVYTLLGRESPRPLLETGGNFFRCLPIAALLGLPGLLVQTITLRAGFMPSLQRAGLG